jgi:hypothetical protein
VWWDQQQHRHRGKTDHRAQDAEAHPANKHTEISVFCSRAYLRESLLWREDLQLELLKPIIGAVLSHHSVQVTHDTCLTVCLLRARACVCVCVRVGTMWAGESLPRRGFLINAQKFLSNSYGMFSANKRRFYPTWRRTPLSRGLLSKSEFCPLTSTPLSTTHLHTRVSHTHAERTFSFLSLSLSLSTCPPPAQALSPK